MKRIAFILGIAAFQITASTVFAQTVKSSATEKEIARQERKAQGAEAARNFQPGEGNPVPDPKAKVAKPERDAARNARKPEGVIASKTFKPGEGNPTPVATSRPPREERRADRAAKRSEIRQANKAGQIPSYGDNYGGK